MAVSAWLSFTLTPLQKIYFPVYSASSVGAQLPGNRTTLRWVMKTAPKRKQVAATPEDVAPGPDPKLPANLSPKAIAEGWRGLTLSAPDKAPSDDLNKMLRQYIYDGASLWRVFGQAVVVCLAGFSLLYLVGLFAHARLEFEREPGAGRALRTANQGTRIAIRRLAPPSWDGWHFLPSSL